MFAPVLMSLDHRFTMRHASEFVDGELGARATARVKRHASICPGCAELIRTLRATVVNLGRLRETPDVGAGESSIVSDVLDALPPDVLPGAEPRPPDDT